MFCHVPRFQLFLFIFFFRSALLSFVSERKEKTKGWKRTHSYAFVVQFPLGLATCNSVLARLSRQELRLVPDVEALFILGLELHARVWLLVIDPLDSLCHSLFFFFLALSVWPSSCHAVSFFCFSLKTFSLIFLFLLWLLTWSQGLSFFFFPLSPGFPFSRTSTPLFLTFKTTPSSTQNTSLSSSLSQFLRMSLFVGQLNSSITEQDLRV